MTNDALFHILAVGAWPEAGGTYRPESLAAEGFVHCSFAHQVEGSANRHFAQAHDLCVIELDPARIGAPVVVEDSYGTGSAFPHVYGPIPAEAQIAVHRLVRDEGGRWRFNRCGGGASASAGR